MSDKRSIQSKNPSAKISVKDVDFQTSIRNFFEAMGEDPDRDGIKQTPKRFEQAMKYMLSGYDRSFEEENRVFPNRSNYKDIIILKNIDFFSVCEHHLLPFFGYAHVGYIPSEEGYLGISKLARAVDIYARRLQEQENLGFQIANAIMKYGKAKGAAVLIEGRHFCNVARGTEKKMTVMTTCAYYGSFDGNLGLQQNFIELVRDREKI
jgi:GTP cyclohydrolase I